MKGLRKSRRPHTCALGTYVKSDLSELTTICNKDSETRSSLIKMKTIKKGEIAKTRYGKNMKTSDIIRIRLIDSNRKKTESSGISIESGKSIVHYRLFKQDCTERHTGPTKPKWCDLEICDDDNDPTFFKQSQRKISVIYKCPELKMHLKRYLEVISKKIKWNKRLIYSYIISRISPERIEVKSEVPITSMGPYLEILENPNLPLWEQLCRTIQLDTGHSVGDIMVNIHLIKG